MSEQKPSLVELLLNALPKAIAPGDDFMCDAWQVEERLRSLQSQNLLLFVRDWFVARKDNGYLFMVGFDQRQGCQIYRADADGHCADGDELKWEQGAGAGNASEAEAEITSFLEDMSGLAVDAPDTAAEIIDRMNAHEWSRQRARNTLQNISLGLGMTPEWLGAFYAEDESEELRAAGSPEEQTAARRPRL